MLRALASRLGVRCPAAPSALPSRPSSSAAPRTPPSRSEAALLDLYAQAVEPRAPPPPPAPDAATLRRWAALAASFTRLKWRRERVLHRDLSRKARLKWAALHALPTEALRREALRIDPHVPLELYVALDTPPLAGFHGPEDAARERARAEEARAATEAAARARVITEGVQRASAPKAQGPAIGGDFGGREGLRKQRLRTLGALDMMEGVARPEEAANKGGARKGGDNKK